MRLGKNLRSRVHSQQTQPTYYAQFLDRTEDLLVKAECSYWCANTIAIFTVYKQFFRYSNLANHITKESFVSTANKPLVGTSMTIGDVTASIAIIKERKGTLFKCLVVLALER